MPARDAETTIVSAISSTLSALPADACLAVCDDASEDATASLIQSISDRRLSVVTNSTPLGVAATLNRLLHLTDSEYIARMDADDYSLPWRFNRELKALGEGADLVFTPVVRFGRRSLPRPQVPRRISTALAPILLVLTNPFAHSTMVGRRASLPASDAYRDVPSEDYDLWLRLANEGARLARISTPALLYRVHPGQITNRSSWQEEARQSEATAKVHAALMATTLGYEDPRLFFALRSAPTDRNADTVAEVRTHLATTAAKLSWGDRRTLTWHTRRLLGKKTSP